MYNDQVVVRRNEMFGHTKGVVGAGKEGGFWLVHSVPHYPTLSETEYAYPRTGLRFGQTFLCLSLQPSQLNILGSFFLITKLVT
jgi:deoxyribonuclease-2